MDTLKNNQFSHYSWQPKLFVSGHKGIYWYHWNPDRLATLSTDSNGKVLYTEDGQPITVTHSLADEAIPSIADKINNITSGQVDFFKYQDPVSQKHFYLFYAPIRSTTYHLGLLVSEDDLTPPIIDTLLIVLTFLMSLFLVLIITYLWNRKNISEPLHQLMSYIRQIHQGHYNQKLNLQTNDELAQVASTLNEMSDAITDRENEIKELNAGLELRVKERTQALEQANLSLEALSMQDELTKLENRRAMEACITNIHKSYLSRHRIYSLLLLDIDYFKPYNDHYGHIKGDETLCKVATNLAHSVRNEDRVYRYGGEEFLILLPDTDQKTALEIAQRTRLNIESIKEPHSASPFGHLTVSVGLATSSENDLEWMSLLQRADERLYSAKRVGRNQIVSE